MNTISSFFMLGSNNSQMSRMTLPAIIVDMSHDKEKFHDGQAYVAFSRVT